MNHAKLKKQLWNLGIRDKNLLSIIGKILKSEVQGIGVPNKGTPQGGIISPLLSNVVLNELDWWISSQWETFQTNYPYVERARYTAMKTTNLKEVFLVRYADDFKIFCRDYETAKKMFVATKNWLKERLGLEVSPDKSKITNLRKNRTEFLGFSMKVIKKANRYACKSNMSNKAKKIVTEKLKNQIKVIQKNTEAKEVNRLNAMILGFHNYYKIATHVVQDFGEINFLVSKTLYNRLNENLTDKPIMTETYRRLYGEYTSGKRLTISRVSAFPIHGCKTKKPMNFSQNINNYTEKGREAMHKKPRALGGTDEYKNLVWLQSDVHKLVHSTKQDTIEKYLRSLNLDEKGLKRVNSLRKLVENLSI